MQLSKFLFYFITIGFISLFTQSSGYSQDTTVVQTFTWDSIGRVGNFDFPNEAENAYEKILMVYNMRCFDAAVGNGSVGCKEWDYSCNTFVHVPERSDSSLAFKYDYEVSGISDDYFAYTTETHHTYYAFDHINTAINNTQSEQSYAIEGETPEDLQIESTSKTKFQFTLSKNELLNSGLNAGEIAGLGFLFKNDFVQLNSFRIDLLELSDTILNANHPNYNKKVNVFIDHVSIENPGIKQFVFHTPFDWDGVSSLLIECSYEGGTGQNLIFDGHQSADKCILSKATDLEVNALEFGGSWGVELEAESFDQVDKEISFAFWAFGRPQDMPSNTSILEAFDANNKRTVNIHLPWSNSGIYWDCGNNGGTYDRIDKIANADEISANWNHWTFTKNAANGSMKIYLNGQLWHSGESKTRTFDIKKFRLGSSVSHNRGYYGMIDDFTTWNVELDEESIGNLMSGSIDTQHPLFGNLLLYYDFESGEGNTLVDRSSFGNDATFEGGPMWRKVKAKNIRQNFMSSEVRPDLTLYTGIYDLDHSIFQEIDTLITPQNSIVQYDVINSQLVAIDTFFWWEADDSRIYSESGEELESFYVEIEDFLFFEELAYYTFRDAKFELLSLVTPYGNGLDLGPLGKTFTFDVTDFAPLLQGNRKLSVEFGATQEELDIKFLFIKGTPSRNVLDIINIWPFARGYYDPIQEDKIFEPRIVNIPDFAKMTKIRSSITGHGQNGEFVARNHRIHLDGNTKVFDFKVWKECAFNPIYPQGGTWIYDRAGWCPGMATDLHEFEITQHAQPGSELEIDYNVFGPAMDQANYLVSNQMVFYGLPNFTLDAALEHIVRPNQSSVEFARYNPNCTDPALIIKNNGTETLNSLEIKYGIQGLNEKTYVWNGTLEFLETTEVVLPIDDLGFWGTEETNTFYAIISLPNGKTDTYIQNNELTSEYKITDIYEGHERWLLRVRTNNRAAENKYKLIDQEGNEILSRQNLDNNTTYDDEMDLPAGCYSFEITDSGNDGLSFWANPAAGSGWVSIRRMVNDNVSFERIKFESDFGGAFKYDFVIDESTSTDQTNKIKRIGIFPNPTTDLLTIDAEGLSKGPCKITIYSINGIALNTEEFDLSESALKRKISTSDLRAGHYLIKLVNKDGSWVKSFIKI